MKRPRPPLTIQKLSEGESHDVVYFSSVSENTRRFVEKLGRPAVRIPLHPRREGMIQVCCPYVLFVPTYGGGKRAATVPKQVIAFLNIKQNRDLIRGVIASGNTNFGHDYCLAGPIISAKCNVPELYRYELIGTPRDVDVVKKGLDEFWKQQQGETSELCL